MAWGISLGGRDGWNLGLGRTTKTGLAQTQGLIGVRKGCERRKSNPWMLFGLCFLCFWGCSNPGTPKNSLEPGNHRAVDQTLCRPDQPPANLATPHKPLHPHSLQCLILFCCRKLLFLPFPFSFFSQPPAPFPSPTPFPSPSLTATRPVLLFFSSSVSGRSSRVVGETRPRILTRRL